MNFSIPFHTYSRQYRYKYQALYHAIRSAVHDGTLPAGTRLPSSRELARDYGLSRGSVAHAYDLLQAEGYVYSSAGSGTYVGSVMSGSGGSQPAAASAEISLSPWGARVMEQFQQPEGLEGPEAGEIPAASGPDGKVISFTDSGPSMSAFPLGPWRSALAWAARAKPDAEGLGPPAGDPELRGAIAAHLRRSRGIAADAEQICLFSGSMQAIALLAQLLLGEGERAVLEDPCYHGIVRAVAACGGAVVPGAVDGDGIIPRDWDARVLFVTPGRQYPTGAVLSPQRRQELLAWAARRNAVIVEDDYDTEFRWAGRPLEPLKALDQGERVVYIGSFTKTMFASLRLGYAVLPRSLVGPAAAAKALYEPVPPAWLEQRALARFMRRGDYERHLRRMRRIYSAKHELFRQALARELPGLFSLKPADAGLLVYANWLRSPREYEAFREAARRRGVLFREGAVYRLSPGPPAACFSFSHLEDDQLLEGVYRLALAWKDISEKQI
ncbi:PLP-dependent aminotransferase family protein [Paenibacillus sp. M1]|uniref:PLP-dependent aminotransferase family protein n=1 Tax=Paenibacillus haidiansis TaxID=1574488 RepID=A0ABU7VW31_9BACL